MWWVGGNALVLHTTWASITLFSLVLVRRDL